MVITWRRAALNDLEAIQEFIAQDNPDAAVRIRTAIRAAVERLAVYPDLGRAGRVEGTRELIFPGTPYIAVYRVIGGQLRILSIIHSSRQWPQRF